MKRASSLPCDKNDDFVFIHCERPQSLGSLNPKDNDDILDKFIELNRIVKGMKRFYTLSSSYTEDCVPQIAFLKSSGYHTYSNFSPFCRGT